MGVVFIGVAAEPLRGLVVWVGAGSAGVAELVSVVPVSGGAAGEVPVLAELVRVVPGVAVGDVPSGVVVAESVGEAAVWVGFAGVEPGTVASDARASVCGVVVLGGVELVPDTGSAEVG